MDREQLIETVAKRVLEELEAARHSGPGECCAECAGACAASCSDKVRCMVDEGACRISFNVIFGPSLTFGLEQALRAIDAALAHKGPSLIVIPIDYRENTLLTSRLGEIASAI